MRRQCQGRVGRSEGDEPSIDRRLFMKLLRAEMRKKKRLLWDLLLGLRKSPQQMGKAYDDMNEREAHHWVTARVY